MTDGRNAADEAALGWIVRQREPDFDAWEEFEAWLAADPAHAALYHGLAEAERRLDPLLVRPRANTIPAPEPIARQRPWLRRSFGLGAAAAAIAAVLSVRLLLNAPGLYEVRTQAGERREVSLPGGTTIQLNGATALRLDRNNPRFAALEHGEALFTVAHDAAHPFAVQLGEDRVVDLGTRFDIVRTPARTEIAVAEGAVLYNPEREQLRLHAGDHLRIAEGRALVTRGRTMPEQVGAWRSGRFVYDGDPLSQVIADLARYTGARIELDPTLESQPFRGVISVPPSKDLAELGPLFQARIRRTADGWLISPR